jgi:hypothetical protein
MAAGATYEPIATQTLASAAASITFSSIAATYTDLRVVIVDTTAVSSNGGFYFNGDTTALYSVTRISGDGASPYSTRSTGDSRFVLGYAATTSTTIPTMVTLDLFSYAGSTFKTGLCTFNADKNGSGGLDYVVGLYRSTSAITSVTFITPSGNLSIGTTATLYGIKNSL